MIVWYLKLSNNPQEYWCALTNECSLNLWRDFWIVVSIVNIISYETSTSMLTWLISVQCNHYSLTVGNEYAIDILKDTIVILQDKKNTA